MIRAEQLAFQRFLCGLTGAVGEEAVLQVIEGSGGSRRKAQQKHQDRKHSHHACTLAVPELVCRKKPSREVLARALVPRMDGDGAAVLALSYLDP